MVKTISILAFILAIAAGCSEGHSEPTTIYSSGAPHSYSPPAEQPTHMNGTTVVQQ